MATPGFYPDSALTVVDENGQRLANEYAYSWQQASEELYREFGWYPKITVSQGKAVGAYRTDAEQKWISPGTSSFWSDHCKGRAVDIGNFNWFHNVNTSKFIAILKKWGWLNVNTAGRPFPSEPWHFANQSSSPAGGDFTPIGSETEMKVISTGSRHVLMSFPDYQNLSNRAAEEEGKIWGTYTATDYEFDRAIARADARKTPTSGGGGGSTDLTPVLEAVAGVSEQVSNLDIPTAEQNGQASRDKIVAEKPQ